MAFDGGPYVQAACLCNMVIEDKTGTLSLIRIVDNLTHQAFGLTPPEDMPPVSYQVQLVLMLKSGAALGRHNLKIIPELPSGETQNPIAQLTVHFEGEEKGQNVISPLNYVFTQEGLYWFNIHLDEEKLTAIPFRVRYHRIVTGSAPTP